MTGQTAAGRRAKTRTTVLVIVAALLFAATMALLLGAAVQKPLDHDEHQFIASAALLARQGRLPYRDYAYFHMPNLVLVYAALFAATDHLLLAARAFSTLCAGLGLAAVFALAWSLFHGRPPWLRFLAGAGAVGLILTNPLFTYTSGKAWNHDLPVLLTLLAFAAFARAAGGRPTGRWLFAAGLGLGLAAGTRLTFALALVPFAAAILLLPRDTGRRPLAGLAAFGLGAALGLLPSLVLFLLDPQAALFGNLGYARYNTLYRQAAGFVEGDASVIAMTLGGKFQYLARYVLSAPGNLLLLLAFLFLAVTANAAGLLRREGPHHAELALLVLLLPFLLAGSLAPTPVFFQYFYAPVPFLVLGALYGAANLASRDRVNWSLVLLAHVAVLSIAYGYKSYEDVGSLLAPQDWLVSRVHTEGREIAAAASATAGAGPVLTLAPLYPLEGGAGVYEEFATGVFAWRVAPFVPAGERRQAGIVSEEELPGLLAERPPAAILVGHEPRSEGPLVAYAEQNHYQPQAMAGGLTLWLAPR